MLHYTCLVQSKAGQGAEAVAHGVYAYKDSLFANISDHVYIPENEGGILWSSIPLLRDFPVTIVSEKDSKLPSLEEVIL